ncbi:MAG: hypothetical protein O2954_06910 [bacterium]|nr:hypothetical protein [bacterium]
MPDIRDSIDEMIEESYLLGLSENEIKEDLDRFIELCGRLIHQHVRDRKQMQKLTEKLARARALSLIEDHQDAPGSEGLFPDEKKAMQSSRERFAEKVARNKRLILRTIRECDPRLEQLVEQARFPDRAPSDKDQPLPIVAPESRSKTKDLFLKTCYVATLLFMLLLVYLVLLQNV